MEIVVTSPKYGNETACIDDEDYEKVKGYKWVVDVRRRGRKYARASVKISKNKFSYVYLHRLIMGFPKYLVDHKDGNGLNNTKDNLRIATCQENQRNQRMPSNNTTGYKGVHFYKAYNKYSVSIRANKKQIFGGYFPTPIEAAKKYNEMAVLYHGEYAKLNKIPNE